MKRTHVIAVLAITVLIWAEGYVPADATDSLKSEAAVSDSATTVSGDSTVVLPHQVVAYYFHGNVRCATCRKMEAYTKEAIDSGFVDELKSGRLEWRAVNTDSSHNKHFTDDYQLYTRSVILSDLHKGRETRWKNLEKIWGLSGNKPEFIKYIQAEVDLFLDTAR